MQTLTEKAPYSAGLMCSQDLQTTPEKAPYSAGLMCSQNLQTTPEVNLQPPETPQLSTMSMSTASIR